MRTARVVFHSLMAASLIGLVTGCGDDRLKPETYSHPAGVWAVDWTLESLDLNTKAGFQVNPFPRQDLPPEILISVEYALEKALLALVASEGSRWSFSRGGAPGNLGLVTDPLCSRLLLDYAPRTRRSLGEDLSIPEEALLGALRDRLCPVIATAVGDYYEEQQLLHCGFLTSEFDLCTDLVFSEDFQEMDGTYGIRGRLFVAATFNPETPTGELELNMSLRTTFQGVWRLQGSRCPSCRPNCLE